MPPATIPAFEGLANSLLTFVNYGITIVFFLILFEVFRLITFKSAGTSAAGLASSMTWGKLKKRWGQSQARSKTKLLNEYVEEQKATGLLHEARDAAQDALREVQHAKAGGQITETERNDAITKIEELKTKLREARGEYRRVNKTTWRQEREMGPILEKLREEGKNVTDLITFENNILKFHKEIVDEIDKVQDYFDKMKAQVKAIKDEPAASFPVTIAGSPLQVPLNGIETNLKDIVYKLTDAFDKQTKVDQEVQGIISKARQLWVS